MTEPQSEGGHEPSAVTIELRLFATIRAAIGAKTLIRRYDPPATIGMVLADLEAAYPPLEDSLLEDTDALRSSISVLRNGRHIDHFDGIETVLDDGDVVVVMPPVSGGVCRRRDGR